MKAFEFLLKALGKSSTADSTGSLSEGDVWSYQTRKGEESSTILIIKTEKLNEKSIIHIRVDGVKVRSPLTPNDIATTIGHMPFDEKILLKSLTKKIKSIKTTSDLQGYDEWKRAQGGVFTIPVKDAISFVENPTKLT